MAERYKSLIVLGERVVRLDANDAAAITFGNFKAFQYDRSASDAGTSRAFETASLPLIVKVTRFLAFSVPNPATVASSRGTPA